MEDQFKGEIENDCEKNINCISDEEETDALSKSTIAVCNIPNLVADYGSTSGESKYIYIIYNRIFNVYVSCIISIK